MATKSTIQGQIDGRVTGTPNLIASERALWQAILDTCYLKADDSYSLETYTDAPSTVILEYQVKFSKAGLGVGRMKGFFTTDSIPTSANYVAFTFKDNEFTPASETFDDTSISPDNFIAHDRVYNSSIRCQLIYISGVPSFKVLSAVPSLSNAKWEFDVIYNLKN